MTTTVALMHVDPQGDFRLLPPVGVVPSPPELFLCFWARDFRTHGDAAGENSTLLGDPSRRSAFVPPVRQHLPAYHTVPGTAVITRAFVPAAAASLNAKVPLSIYSQKSSRFSNKKICAKNFTMLLSF